MEDGVVDWHHVSGHVWCPIAYILCAAALCAWASGQGAGLASIWPGFDPRSGHFYYLELISILAILCADENGLTPLENIYLLFYRHFGVV